MLEPLPKPGKKKVRDPRYDRGRDFELKIARIMRQKGITAYRDPRSGAGTYKADLRIPGQPLHMEAKSHDKIRLHEFWAKALEGASHKTPVLVLDLDGYTSLAVLKFEDLCDLIKTITDDSITITKLRSK